MEDLLTELFDHKSKVDKIVGGLLDSLLLPLINVINQEQTRDFRETLRALTEKALQKYNPQRPIMEKLKDQTNFIKELNKLRESNGLGQKIVWSTPLDMTPLLKKLFDRAFEYIFHKNSYFRFIFEIDYKIYISHFVFKL